LHSCGISGNVSFISAFVCLSVFSIFLPRVCLFYLFIFFKEPDLCLVCLFINFFISILQQAFSLAPLLLLNLTGINWAAMGEKTQDRQTGKNLGPNVLGPRVEMHNLHCFFSLLFLFIYSASFLYLYSLRSYSFTIL
jgi:hypothetical protein